MSALTAAIDAAAARAVLLGQGIAGAARLLPVVLGQGAVALADPAVQRDAFAALRAFAPNLVLSKKLVTAYPNTGTAIVTRQRDVIEVLDREADFAVVYEPKMRAITGGANFFLGMQDSADYARDTSLMRLAMRREDVGSIVTPLVTAHAEAAVAAQDGGMDVAADLTLPAATAIVEHYFGTPHPDVAAWATAMFWYLFVDLKGEPAIEAAGLAAAAACRAMLDAAIAARKTAPTPANDVLARCLALQASGTDGFDDTAIRDNLIGMVIGCIPTLSKAAIQALDTLLARPDALAGAQRAASEGDMPRLAAHVFEALRFNPVNPVIYRRALRDTVIARGTARARPIRAGTMVLAANLSAMFDPIAMPSPTAFRTNRPWGDYLLWGYGLHTCAGAHINRAVIPAMLRPVLAREGLRRAGPVDGGGTPFPQHFRVAWAA